MLELDRTEEFLSTVRGASTLAAKSEQGYVFVYHDGGAWKVTEDAEVWIAQGADAFALMVHPDGRDDYVEPGNWREVLALHRERDEARRKKQAITVSQEHL